MTARERIPVLYLAPWVDFGGSDKGTIDWFRWLDRDRFAPSLIVTQPSDNRRLGEIHPFAEEVWALPDLMSGSDFPRFIFDFVHTRGIQLIHMMNSRIGFELLPDLRSLPAKPPVVVQFHVEEPDRGGYVRYVTTRYGNLVDAFSVSSHHLAAAMTDYHVPRSKIEVITTGVDAMKEFNPHIVDACPELARESRFKILFAGRLVEQKDPLLMVEIIRRVTQRRGDVRVDVVGDGPLEEAVRSRAQDVGLDATIQFHPPAHDLARWLAGADVLLMTSAFEGVPYVAYEALAMEVPVVAPSLPGLMELMEDLDAHLIPSRADADAYASAVVALIDDPERRKALAARGRVRMLEQHSLRQMAAGHEALYERLATHRTSMLTPFVASPRPRLEMTRPVAGEPLVSVVTPCYNHGPYLPELIESVEGQDYPNIEMVIVDDASTDPDTRRLLNDVAAEPKIRVLRQAENSGPSAARNRAVDVARGRYILPVDADNVLMPGAVSRLVQQLQGAGECVGFIYPVVQYFGNRDYCFWPPEYNLHSLLHGNFVDTGSLIDRDVFDAGLRYPEDIKLGHEDWDFALAAAAQGVVGQPSRAPVMLYRKHGFTRSDLVEYLRLPFWQEIQDRHPELFGGPADVGVWGRYRGPGLAVKSGWSPGLAVIPTHPVELDDFAGASFVQSLEAQTYRDFELIVESARVPRGCPVRVRRIPPGLTTTVTERLAEAIGMSRARFLIFTDAPAELLSDPSILEKVVRSLRSDEDLDAVAFAAAEGGRWFPTQLMARAPHAGPAHALAVREGLAARVGSAVELADGQELESLARTIHSCTGRVHWRHYPVADGIHAQVTRHSTLELERGRATTSAGRSARAEREQRLGMAPAIPTMPASQVPRWGLSLSWMPPETIPLVRHVSSDRTKRVVTNDRLPPPGYEIEFDLGAIQRFSPPGTRRLVLRGGARFLTLERGAARIDDDRELGYLEEVPLPLFIGIERAVLADGTETLVSATGRDTVRAQARELEFLGFVESFPTEPVQRPPYTARPAAPVLLRWVDRQRRRHFYTAVTPPVDLGSTDTLAAELGSLCRDHGPETTALWVDERGHLATDDYEFEPRPVSARARVRWAAAPLAWRKAGSLSGRSRAVGRRSVDAAAQIVPIRRLRADVTRFQRRSSAAAAPPRLLLGYLERRPREGLIELFVARHPVLDDQFVTHRPVEATDMGYVDVQSLGYIEAAAPLTGSLERRVVAVPWASRFGLAVRHA